MEHLSLLVDAPIEIKILMLGMHAILLIGFVIVGVVER